MSGGSFDYFCYAEPMNLLEKMNSLKDMIEYVKKIHDIPNRKEIVNKLCVYYDYLKKTYNEFEQKIKEFYELTHAIEWKCSGDSGIEEIIEAFKKMNK